MADWLMVRPLFDEVTQYTFDEGQDVLDYFEEKGISYIDLAKEDAVREKVEEILKENADINILHYDHGSEDKIWGNDESPVIDLNNIKLLKGRDCYNNNCSSAKKLGIEAWKLRATFWGYTDVFIFSTDSLEEFKTAVNWGIKRRVDGLSWKDCLQKTKEKMTELIDKLVETGRALAASCMRHDREHLVCYNAHPPGEDDTDCWFRKQAIHLFGPKFGWKLPSLQFLRKPAFWIILVAMVLAETLFWVSLLQIDSMWWSIPGDWQDWMWIPEFGLTYRNCFLMFFNMAVLGFHILVIIIIWLAAEKLTLKKSV